MGKRIVVTTFVGLLAATSGCGDGGGGGGNVAIVLQAEDTIPDGIPSGTGDEEITDGYSASFSRYIVTVGFVDMAQVDGTNPQTSDTIAVADYTSLPATLPELTAFNGIATGQYSEFAFQTPAPTSDVVNINSVSQNDIDDMIANGWTYIIKGTLTQVSDGATLDFLIEADVPTMYFGCGVEGLEPGINVGPSGSSSITLHGDHIFFNGFPADESAVTRLAAWMWMVDDTNSDGMLTQVDFEAATDVGALYPSPQYSDINSGPAGTINNAWDFIRSQLSTQGHIDGEGECQAEL